MRTHPRGSFLILGLIKALFNAMSAGFSSLAHFSKFLQTNTISLVTQSISVKLVSKTPLPRSCLFASRSSASWSFTLRLSNQQLVCYAHWRLGMGSVRPIELPQLDQAKFKRSCFVGIEGAPEPSRNRWNVVDGCILKIRYTWRHLYGLAARR